MPKINEMYAFVVEDTGPDDEGITGCYMRPGAQGSGQWMPFVGADMQRVEQLKPMAAQVARAVGKPVKVLRFSVREEIEVIQP